jgi:hypothetical protein
VLLVPAGAFAVPNHKTPFAFALMIEIPRFLDHSKGCLRFGHVRNCQNNDGSPITDRFAYR